jgi:hypothetical protein
LIKGVKWGLVKEVEFGSRFGGLAGKGEGRLTRINDILANLMEAERRAGSGK